MNPLNYVQAFIVGGLLCVLAQLVVDLTPSKFTPAHTMVSFVMLGAVASAFGLYEPLVKFGGAGATIPLTGFGHALVNGALKEATEFGPQGLITGGMRATALGLTVAVIFGYLMAILFNPKG